MPQFVVLRHDTPQGVHFDFMLESAGMLKTWALPRLPESDAEIPCEMLADHRLAYLDEQGPISGGRGTVVRWDRGDCIVTRQGDAEWMAELAGEKIAGTAIIRRSADDPSRWTFSFTKGP